VCFQFLDAGNCVASLDVATGRSTSNGTACLGFTPAFTWGAAIDRAAGHLWGVGGSSPRRLVQVDLATGRRLRQPAVGGSTNCPYALAPGGPDGRPYALWFDLDKCPKQTGGYCFVSLNVSDTGVEPLPLAGVPVSVGPDGGNVTCFPASAGNFAQVGRTTGDGSYATLWICGDALTAVVVSPFGGSSSQITLQGVSASSVIDWWAAPSDGALWVLQKLGNSVVAVREVFYSGAVDTDTDFRVHGVSPRVAPTLAPVDGGFCVVAVPPEGSAGVTRVECTYGSRGGDGYARVLSNAVPGFGSASQPYNSVTAPTQC
jgi:hypothetical protein